MRTNNILDSDALSGCFDDSQLFEKLLEYIKQEDSIEYALQPLCMLYEKNWEPALSLIDYVFQHHFYNKMGDDYNIYMAFEIDDEETYERIKWGLEGLVRDSLELNNKEEIRRNLDARIKEEYQLTFYLARRYAREKREEYN